MIERYVALVYSSAYRRTGGAEDAGDVTRAVFLVLARRARKLRKKTVLAGWLFLATALACRKISRQGRRRPWWRLFARRPKSKGPVETTLWARVAPELDGAIDRLPARRRNALLLRVVLNRDCASVAETLRTSEQRATRRAEGGLKKLARRFGRRGIPTDSQTLAQVCSVEACAVPLPEGLLATIGESIEATGSKRPSFKLARRVLRTMAWARWRRRCVVGIPCFLLFLAAVGGLAWHIDGQTGHSRLISAFVVWSVRWQAHQVAEPARPWPTSAAGPRLDATAVRNAGDLYQMTNVWLAHMGFAREQWKGLEPTRIAPLPNFRLPNGMWLLRNPEARRNGLAGVFGYEFQWTHADFEFGGMAFTNVAVRLKGNIRSLFGSKRAFKADLNKFAKGQKLGGLDELNFDNLVWDYSCLGDALAYEFFREAGVPAPRTAYVWLSQTVEKQWERKPLGLYLMVEPVDGPFVAERFGSRKTPVFKPVTYELFADLGGDWPAYAGIYDLKTQAAPEQLQRVIDFARLVSSASDAEFAAQVEGFLDLDEFGRFLAGEVLLSSYDSLLTTGQNFYMYLNPRSNKFGFIPWDLDAAWGGFWIASPGELERASIWHPWVGKNRFLERLMGVEVFRRIYRAHLEDFLSRLFVPDRLYRRIDELAGLIREPIAAESGFRLSKFDQAVGRKPIEPAPQHGINDQAHDLKRFIRARARSVRQQLDGKSPGMIVKTPAEK